MFADVILVTFAAPFVILVIWGYALIAGVLIANLRARLAQRPATAPHAFDLNTPVNASSGSATAVKT